MKVCTYCRLEYHDDVQTHCVVDGSPLERVHDARLGTVLLGRYAIEAEIGTGGMAVVYRARTLGTGRPVAIKIMHEAISADPELRERFRREIRHASSIAHENVVSMLDAGETEDGRPLLVMELLEGETLREMMARLRLPTLTIVVLAVHIARGLARAHDLGIVHRDLKPENVFVVVRDDGAVVAKLMDFGIARATQDAKLTLAGALLGTPAYLAPERIRGATADGSSDLYSLGVMLFEMITGRLPFLSESLQGFLIHHMESAPPSPRAYAPSCPVDLEAVTLRLLQKTREERGLDAHQVARALEGIRTHLAPDFRESAWADSTTPEQPLDEEPQRRSVTSLSGELWEKRAHVLLHALREAYRGGPIPASVIPALATLEHGAPRLEHVREICERYRAEIETLHKRANERRERVGHAVHALGSDLSAARADVEQLRAALARREAEVADLEYQVEVLRENIEESERANETEKADAEFALQQAASEVEVLRAAIGEAAGAVVAALRQHPHGNALLARLD